jgi:2-polyprenyl-3-methyl-5-hydroxy-6-metoxy-1,4-benzoquinol methylase
MHKLTKIQTLLKFIKMNEFIEEIPIDTNCEVCESNKSRQLRETISLGNNHFVYFPIHCCENCGFIFQKKKFSKEFYNHYYSKIYREITFNSKRPPAMYLQDQKIRGEKLYKFLRKYIPTKGKMVDIGSSVGLMMLPFIKKGWDCYGCDPIESYVNYGKEVHNLPVECIQSENLKLKNNSIDLFLILGSLEHVVDVNLIFQKILKAAKKNALIVLEARGDPLGDTKKYFNFNHHRYFLNNTLELILIKYGFKPILTTKYPISGNTRQGTIFSIARLEGNKISKNFNNVIKYGKRETFDDVYYKLKYYDYLSEQKPLELLLR